MVEKEIVFEKKPTPPVVTPEEIRACGADMEGEAALQALRRTDPPSRVKEESEEKPSEE